MAKTVVIVDDSKFILSHLKTFMEEDMGLDVVGVGHNGLEAIELYKKHKPDFITLDITMPMMDGSQALKEIILEFPDAKVIMMTAVRDSEMNSFLSDGAAGFIQKPLKFQDPQFMANTKELILEILEEDE